MSDRIKSSSAQVGDLAANFIDQLEAVEQRDNVSVVVGEMVILASYREYDRDDEDEPPEYGILWRRRGAPHAVRGLLLSAADCLSFRGRSA